MFVLRQVKTIFSVAIKLQQSIGKLLFCFILRAKLFTAAIEMGEFYGSKLVVTISFKSAKFNYQRILNDKLIDDVKLFHSFKLHQQLIYPFLKSIISEII